MCIITYKVRVSIVASPSDVVAACPAVHFRGVWPQPRGRGRLCFGCLVPCLPGDESNGDDPVTEVPAHGGCRGHTLLALMYLVSSAASSVVLLQACCAADEDVHVCMAAGADCTVHVIYICKFGSSG